MSEQFTALIMAAGQGTRMRSSVPKVLHPVAGKPMVQWVIEAAQGAGAARTLCVTRPGDGVAEGLQGGVEVVEQVEGEGTGSAVLAARERLDPDETIVVLSADHPLVGEDLIEELLASHRRESAAATILTSTQLDPAGYGRIERGDEGSVKRIVETKHTDSLPPHVLDIREVNVGTYAFSAGDLMAALDEVGQERGEVYLTGVFPVLADAGKRVATHTTEDTLSALGINSRVALMEAERVVQQRLMRDHAAAGVTFLAPQTTYLDADVQIGADTVIGPGVTIRSGTTIGTNCELRHAYLEACEVHDGVTIGPFAYLRPGTIVREGAKVGTFVELKNADIGPGAKVPHLSYLGDAEVGEGANVAAGNITANYDGFEKHRTTIGKRAKTGIHSSFVAPVHIGDEAYTGAGSVIREDVPDGALGITSAEQKNVEGYAKRKAEEKGKG